MFQTFAERAVRIGEHGNLQLAVAAHFFDGIFKRQLAEIHRVHHRFARLGQALAVVRADKVAHQHIVARSIGIDYLFAVYQNLIQPRHRRAAHRFHFQLAVGITRFQRLLDFLRGFGSNFGCGGRRRQRCGSAGRLRGCFGFLTGGRRLAAGGKRKNGNGKGGKFHGHTSVPQNKKCGI